MTGGRLFLIAMIIASFIAPAARSENCRPTAQIWVNAFSLPASRADWRTRGARTLSMPIKF
jgi:hypothetical protein